MNHAPPEPDTLPILPETVPVEMPELPPRLLLTAAEQFKAVADPTRSRILGIIQNQPATAKQIADRLGIAPGAAGHHLQVLEAAGLAQVVAKRLVRGIVAKYYARTARIFTYEFPRDVTGGVYSSVNIISNAANELVETMAEGAEQRCLNVSFPHVRLSAERASVYAERVAGLVEDLLREPFDPAGQVFGLAVTMFIAPDYLQRVAPPAGAGDEGERGGEL